MFHDLFPDAKNGCNCELYWFDILRLILKKGLRSKKARKWTAPQSAGTEVIFLSNVTRCYEGLLTLNDNISVGFL